jgi:hypothetical protein
MTVPILRWFSESGPTPYRTFHYPSVATIKQSSLRIEPRANFVEAHRPLVLLQITETAFE